MQGCLVSDQAVDDRLLGLAADLQAVEPGGPPAVQDTRYADLITGFAGPDLLIVAAWGAAGLLIAVRKFSWLPLGR